MRKINVQIWTPKGGNNEKTKNREQHNKESENDLSSPEVDLSSLTLEALIEKFEKEFDIQIPDDKAEAIATVGDAISFIEAA